MKKYQWNAVPLEQLNDKVRRRMITGTNEMLVQWEFVRGAYVGRHSHPHEQIVVMRQGRLKLIVGDSETVMGPDDIVVIPPNVVHEAEALEDTVVTDIFSPPREDFLTGDTPDYFATGGNSAS